jgi:inner membrane transporter RhtA
VPVALVIVAIISIQLGAAIAKTLFPLIGPQGTTALRLAFSSILMLGILRPWRMRLTPAARKTILIYGVALGGMNLLFYMALGRVPWGSPWPWSSPGLWHWSCCPRGALSISYGSRLRS